MSISAIVVLLLYVIGLFGALLIDGALGIYLYQADYFLNPKERWWGRELPQLRYGLIIAIVTMVVFVFKMKIQRKFPEKVCFNYMIPSVSLKI